MNSLRLLQFLLVIHLSGFTLMAGTTTVSFLAFRNFSKSANEFKDAANFYVKKIFGLSILLLLGGILMVSSGVGLLMITHAYGQLWFLVKMGLVLALIVNGFLFGSRQEHQIKLILNAAGGQTDARLQRPVANLRIFFAIQLFLQLLIVVLAVVKPG